MAYNVLEELQKRLDDLLLKQSTEEASSERSERYLEDLAISIKSCQDQIHQLSFARNNPLTIVNGAVQ